MSLLDKKNLKTHASDHTHLHGADPRARPPVAGMAFDPVCNMWLDPETAAARSEHEGRSVHFCAVRCKTVFDGNPAKFAARLVPTHDESR